MLSGGWSGLLLTPKFQPGTVPLGELAFRSSVGVLAVSLGQVRTASRTPAIVTLV